MDLIRNRDFYRGTVTPSRIISRALCLKGGPAMRQRLILRGLHRGSLGKGLECIMLPSPLCGSALKLLIDTLKREWVGGGVIENFDYREADEGRDSSVFELDRYICPDKGNVRGYLTVSGRDRKWSRGGQVWPRKNASKGDRS